MKAIVYTDFVCPYCYVGMELAKKLEKEAGIEFEYRYKEIHPGIPVEGINAASYYSQDYIDNVNATLKKVGEPYGLDIKMSPLMGSSFNTLLVYYYLEANNPSVLPEFKDIVYKEFFINGKNVGSENVLKDIVQGLGLDREIVDKAIASDDAYAAMQNNKWKSKIDGANVIPTFVIGDQKVKGLCSFEDMMNVIKGEKAKESTLFCGINSSCG